MSSYYSQSVQYKLQGNQQTNYVPHQPSATVNNHINTRKRYSHTTNTVTGSSGKSNGTYTNTYNSGANNNGNDVTSTSASGAKKMSHYTTKSAGKRNSNTILDQKSGTSTYVTYDGTSANDTSFNKFDVQNPSPKINSHLLDHGYGAAPQPTLDDDDDDDVGCGSSTVTTKSYQKSTDGVITNYYKVKR